MMRQKNPQQNKRWSGGGFTLIELLVAMIIIAVLISLLLPAVTSAIRNARDAEVKTEIGQLDTALAAFKAKYGQYPPSYIKLRVGYDPSGSPGAGWDDTSDYETVFSRSIIQSFWPSYDFNTAGANLPWTDGTELYGSDCLVFFLGGVTETVSGKDLVGFSKDPTNPFARTGDNRDRPLFEFNADRLVYAGSVLTYMDPLVGQTSPYIYISANNGRGYNTGDLNGAMTNVYSQSSGVAWKQESYQIISPGADMAYGSGGVYSVETADTDLSGSRADERDNITNFHNGRLAP